MIRKALATVDLRGSIPPAEILDQMPFTAERARRISRACALIVPGRALMLTESGGRTDRRPDSRRS